MCQSLLLLLKSIGFRTLYNAMIFSKHIFHENMIIGEPFVKIQVKYKNGLSLYKVQLKSERSQMRIFTTLMKWALQWTWLLLQKWLLRLKNVHIQASYNLGIESELQLLRSLMHLIEYSLQWLSLPAKLIVQYDLKMLRYHWIEQLLSVIMIKWTIS